MRRIHLYILGGLAIAVTYFGAGYIASHKNQIEDPKLSQDIKENIAKLNIKARSGEAIYEKAARTRAAILKGEFATARASVASVLADSHVRDWDFYPFDNFIGSLNDLSDPRYEAQLDAWVEADKGDPMPLLVRAQYNLDTGWRRRGTDFIWTVSQNDSETFEFYLRKASVDLDASIDLTDSIPYSFDLKLQIDRSMGNPGERAAAFAKAIAKYPGYYALYLDRISALQPKWGGSIGEMYDFADRYAGGAPDESPLKLLYLQLYSNILEDASMACIAYRGDHNALKACVAAAMARNIRPELEGHVLSALRLFETRDKVQFENAVSLPLMALARKAGGEIYFGAVLQLLADSMHSDTQIIEDPSNRNDYVIDLAVAESWYWKGNYDNVVKKDLEALRDVAGTTFPDGEQKDMAIAKIYGALARVYGTQRNFPQAISYEEAALELGGHNNQEEIVCSGYAAMHLYDDGLIACNKAVAAYPTNLRAVYWRATLLRDLGRSDDALRDLKTIADSGNSFRAYAAILMSVIYFEKRDVQNGLQVLNSHPYLFDPRSSNQENIALAYNNRCYAYMQLGDDQKALDDCTASLKFGSLPDAYSKQEKLVKRLGVRKTQL